MRKTHQMIILFILSVVLIGCEQLGSEYLFPMDYMYTTHSRQPVFTEAEIKAYPNIGVAILSQEGPRDPNRIERGLNDFVHASAKAPPFKEILYTDIGSAMDLNANGEVVNAEYILEKCPEMRYALYVREGEQQVEKDRHSQPRTLKRKSDGKEKTVYDSVYETTMTVDVEFVLFDLVDNIVLAKALDTLSLSETRTKEYKENNNSFADEVVGFIVNTITYDSNYPEVTIADVEKQYKRYTYHFFKRISMDSK